MAGEEILGHGKIIVEVEQNVKRELAEAEAQFDRTMEKLDRKEAELKLAIDAKQFDAEYKKIEAQLAEWNKKRATATATVDTKKAQENIDRLEKKQKNLQLAEERLNNRSKQIAADRAATEEKYMKVIERGEQKLTAARLREQKVYEDATKKVNERITKDTEKSFQDRARVADRSMRDQIKGEEQRFRAVQKAHSDSERLREIELGQVKKLQAEYFKLSKSRAKMADKRQRVFLSENERVEIDVDMAALDEKLARVRERLMSVGHPPPTIEFDVDERGTQALARWSKALTDTTVRLGPFTTTIGGAVRALTLLGPVIAGVVGAAGALAGAMGAGVVGAVGLGATALTGFIPLLIGTVAAVKPIIKNFSDASKAQKKFDDAVAKYGSKSKQAKEAQKELNSVMAHMPESSQKAVKGVNDLKNSWQKATQATARQNFAKVLNSGLESANKLMPMFAARTRGFMNRVGDGFKSFFTNLSSGGNQFQLDRIFSNTNKSITPLMSGLSHLTTAFLRIAGSFSDFLPGIAKGFNDWALGVAKAAGNTQKTRPIISGLVDAFKGLVHFVGSATKLVATFFGVAAGPGGGIDFMGDLADGMDRITASISGNPKGLGNFFKDSIGTAKDLYGVIQPLAALFIEWATIMRPFSNIILDVAGGFGQIVSAMAKFGPTKALLIGAFSVFLAGTLVSKIMSVAGAVREVTTAISTLGKAKVAGAVLDFVTGGASGNVAGAFGRRGAKKATTTVATDVIDYAAVGGGAKVAEKAAAGAAMRIGALEAVTVGAGSALAGLGTAGTIAATGGLALVAGAAVYGGYKLLTMKSSADKLRDSIKTVDGATKTYRDAVMAGAQASDAAGESQHNYEESLGRVATLKDRLNRLERDGKKGTSEYKDALSQLNSELQNRQKYENDAQKYMGLASQAQQRQTEASNKMVGVRKTLNDALKKQADAQKYADATAGNPNLRIAGQKKLAEATKEVETAQGAYNRTLSAQQQAARQAAVNAINYQRTLNGLIPVAGKAATAIANLSKRAPNMTQKISLKYADPKDAGAVAARANAALKSGVSSKIVTTVAVNSANAEQALRRLRALTNIKSNLTIVEKGGDNAISVLTKIKGTKLTPKQQSIAEKGGAKALALLTNLLGIKLPTKTLHTVESGGKNALNILARILGIKIPPKVVHTSVQDGATAALNALRAKAGQPITQVVNFKTTGYGGATRRARGRGPEGSEQALVGEGGGPELIADHRTGNILKVDKPTLIHLKPTESVIPTEPRYRDRGRRFFSNFARDVGIPMFAAGKGAKQPTNRPGTAKGDAGYYPTMFTSRAPGAYTEGRRKKNIKGAGFGKGLKLLSNSPAAQYVKSLQIKESDLGDEIALKERAIKEPDTFLYDTGQKDANGDPVMAINYAAIDSYKASLADLNKWQDNLVSTIGEEVKYLPTALDQLANIRRDSSSNIGKLTHEQTRLEKMLSAEQGKKKPNKAKVKNLKNRISSIKKETTRENKIHDDSVTDLGNFKDRQRQAGFDYRNAQQDSADTQADIKGVDGAATDQAKSATGGGSGGGGGGGGTGSGSTDAPGPGDTSVAKGGYEVAAGKAANNVQQQIQGYGDQIGGYNAQIAAAQGMLTDGDPNNDDDAYNIMASATSSIADATAEIAKLTDPLGGLTPGEAAINRTDALVAEAKAGIADALTGTVPNLTDALKASLSAHEARLAEYQGMLKDADATNDATAWQGVASESGTISGIKDDMGTSVQAAYNNATSLSGARQSLFTSMANNFQLAGKLGTTGAFSGVTGARGNSAVMGAGTNVTVNNSFSAPPPDPHAFSTGLKFELKATM